MAMMTSLAVGFVLLLFVLVRQALRGTSQTPETAEKLSRLGAAFVKATGYGR